MINSLSDLYKFVKKYYEGYIDKFTLDENELPKNIPDVLRDYYCEIGALTKIMPSEGNHSLTPLCSQDALASPEELEYSDGFVEFACENQGNWICRVQCDSNDPEVFSNAAELFGEGEGFQSVNYPLSKFLITLTLQEIVMSAPFLISLNVEDPREGLNGDVQPLWNNGKTAYNENSHDFFIVENTDLLLMNYYGDAWLASKSESLEKYIKEDCYWRFIY
ncbi:MAG: hypothetical protein F6K47_08535 [Symploca sp. SIO2E6]|nr:hypothetical protein [Symploca sp. SIO2E6]